MAVCGGGNNLVDLPNPGFGDGGQGFNPGNGGNDGFNPGTDNYAPVQPNYAPVEPNYAPVQPNYAPVETNYAPVEDDCEDCAQLVRTVQKVQVPCTRNVYKQYEVKVPRTVNQQVARQVNYVDYETRDKQVSYTVNREETRYKDQLQQYNVPVTKQVTKMVNVTRKVPKTIYVDVVTQEPREENITTSECRTKTVRIPYTVNVPETRYKTVQERVPVDRTKTVYDNVQKTIYQTEVRTKCVPETKIVTKEVPVYRVVTRPPNPCTDCEPCQQVEPVPQPVPQPLPTKKITVKTEYSAPKKYDTNDDGVLDEEERALAAAQGQLRVESREVVEDDRKKFLQKPVDPGYGQQPPQPPLDPGYGQQPQPDPKPQPGYGG